MRWTETCVEHQLQRVAIESRVRSFRSAWTWRGAPVGLRPQPRSNDLAHHFKFHSSVPYFSEARRVISSRGISWHGWVAFQVSRSAALTVSGGNLSWVKNAVCDRFFR